MSERPAVVFGLLVAAAALLTSLLVAGLAALGGPGIAGLAATLVGALSACVFFLTELRQVPLTSLALVAFALASALGCTRALLVYRREQRLLGALPLERIEAGELAELATSAGAPQLYVTPARRPVAFCFGLLRPRVVLTSGLLDRLNPDEQAAVVWHEAQHARVREPLRCLLARLAVSTFFWIPALADLLERYLLTKEIAADRVATGRTSRRALAGALHEVIAQPTFAGTIGFADVAAARVDRLFDQEAKLPPLFRPARLILSATGLSLLAVVLAFPARLAIGERAQMESMLTTMSLHGLPGMAAGLAVNAAVLTCLGLAARRFAGGRSREKVASQ